MEKYLESGIVVNTHGVRGDVKILNLCDSPKVFSLLQTLYVKENDAYRALKCTKNSIFGKNMLIVHFEGVDTFEDAVKFKGFSVFADRDDIPLGEGDFFIADVIGLPVIDSVSGEIYGKVADIFNQGAQDLYEIEKKDGSRALIPAVPEFIIRVDIKEGVYVSLIEGLL